jgi:Zn-dependent protease with chaperone function
MTLAVVLLVAATALVVAGPRWLRTMDRHAPPSLTLTAWIGSVVGTFVLIATATVTTLWPDHTPAERALELAARCLSVLIHSADPRVGEGVAAVAVVAVVAAILRLARSARAHLRSGSAIRDRHLDVLALVARPDPGTEKVMWLDHPLPLAYSIDGRPGVVVATNGLLDHLDRDQRQAVLLHERAHLAGRHHRIVSACEILAAAFPFVPLFRAAPAAVRDLVELCADQAAADATSADTVRSALAAVSHAEAIRPSWALGLMSASTTSRMDRLAAPPPPFASERAGARIAVAVLPAAVLGALAALTVSGTSVLACTVLPI